MRVSIGVLVAVGLMMQPATAWAQRTVSGAPIDLLPPNMRGETPPAAVPVPSPKKQPKPAKRVVQSQAQQTQTPQSPIPVDIPPSSVPTAPSVLPPITVPTPPAVPAPVPAPVIVLPPPKWSVDNASKLLAIIGRIGGRGLIPSDYDPEALKAAIAAGEGDALNAIATASFAALATDLRDGRTPKSARVQWLVRDTDAETLPIRPALDDALATGEIGEVLASLEPASADYARLLDVLERTPATDRAKVQLIRTNLDRWRWMPQSMGVKHLLANVPEFKLRVLSNNKILANYGVIVGKLNTQTPSLDAVAQGVVIHPPWNLPRSIINESVGALIARSPATARARGYTWTGSGKTLYVTQQPGPNSALGVIKVDMPNAESIFIHDTPSRHLFAGEQKALSHGCLRTDRAMELGILLGILQGGGTAEELAELIKAGKTERVPFKETIPVFITYFTMATDVNGVMRSYNDLYGRDAAVAATFAKPRSLLNKAAESPTAIAAR